MNSFIGRIFEPKRTPQQEMLIAFSSTDPDQRRESLTKVAESDAAHDEWAVSSYVTIALLDDDAQARCVALRALAQTDDPRAVDACVQVLNYRDYPNDVRTPTSVCRWDAAEALADLASRGVVTEEQRDKTVQTFLTLLQLDTDWHARAAAARGLGNFPAREVVTALIRGLEDKEFSVVYECEESLVRLTGVTNNCNPLAWERWQMEHADDLFAHRGEVPESRQPPYSTRVGKAAYNMKEFWKWLVPERKEK